MRPFRGSFAAVCLSAVGLFGCKKEAGPTVTHDPTSPRDPSHDPGDPTGVDDGVLATNDDVIRAYNAATNSDVKCAPDKMCDLCIERSDAFQGIVIVGGFAYDRGCELEGIFVGKTFEKDVAKAIPSAFARAGWAKADDERRKKLALAWLPEVAARFDERQVVTTPPAKDFAAAPKGTPAFAPPAAEMTASRGVVVKAWWSRGNGGGKMPTTEITYTLDRWEIGGDAASAKDETVAEFKVPYTK